MSSNNIELIRQKIKGGGKLGIEEDVHVDLSERKEIMKLEESDEEDEPPPNSEVWDVENLQADPRLDKFSTMELLDPKFDFRRDTRRGKKSFANFSIYLQENIEQC
jgi:hypothetical protein